VKGVQEKAGVWEEVRVYDRRVDLGKSLEELVGRVGVVLRYVRVAVLVSEICLWMWMLYQRGAYGDWKAIP